MCCLSQELLINTFYLEKNNEELPNPVDSMQRLSPLSVHFFMERLLLNGETTIYQRNT